MVEALGKEHRHLSGKWLVFAHRRVVDGLWGSIASAVSEGRLGPGAKVSPSKRECVTSFDDDVNHVICVYVANWTCRDEVMRVRSELSELGVEEPISFKPDIYTILGIYKNNEWGIPPTILRV